MNKLGKSELKNKILSLVLAIELDKQLLSNNIIGSQIKLSENLLGVITRAILYYIVIQEGALFDRRTDVLSLMNFKSEKVLSLNESEVTEKCQLGTPNNVCEHGRANKICKIHSLNECQCESVFKIIDLRHKNVAHLDKKLEKIKFKSDDLERTLEIICEIFSKITQDKFFIDDIKDIRKQFNDELESSK